jgi:hypothetical protein
VAEFSGQKIPTKNGIRREKFGVYKQFCGSGAFKPQGSGIRDDFFPDPGSLPRPKFKILPLKMAKNRKN